MMVTNSFTNCLYIVRVDTLQISQALLTLKLAVMMEDRDIWRIHVKSPPQWEKSPKKQSEGVHFVKFGTQNTVPYCQKSLPSPVGLRRDLPVL